VIGEVLGHFRILEKLGAGGMGEVYLALDLKLDRKVALKFIHPTLAMDPEARKRFEREARALAALDHSYVGAVYGVEEANGRLFMVLAYIDGQSLDAALSQGPLSPGRARALLPKIAEGLEAAHRRGLVHRDMKCSNVMIADGDVPKVVDFGIALFHGETRLTETGLYSGTPGYTAPEVFRGEPSTPRSDVFSLGVIFYQALTGLAPFAREHPAAALNAVLNEDPLPFPPELALEVLALEPIVRRCLEKDPHQRYADAGEVADALRAAIGTAPSTAWAERTVTIPHQRTEAPLQRRSRWRRSWTVTLVVLVGAGVAAWFVTQRRAGAPPPGAGGEKRSVAVLAFENVTGDPSLDWMERGIAELLGSALLQSPALDVFDAQRIADLAANDRAPNPSSPSFSFLARHRIQRAIAGSILRSGGALRIQGRIVDTDGGRTVQSYAVEGPADSGLFNLVGRLVPDLQVGLEVNLTGNREAEGWLREITTTSVDAYRLYLSGHQALIGSRWREAAAAFEQALAIDSSFIAARTELSGAYWNLGDMENLGLTRAAMQRLRSRADHRGQLRIDLMEAVVAGDSPLLIRSAAELARLYPENRFYTYLLGRGYFTSQQYARCLETLRPLVEQRYEWPYTYVLSARSAEHLGDLATARRDWELGFEVSKAEPEFSYAYIQFLHGQGDQDRIRAVLDQALRHPALKESPVGEGELRLELARDFVSRGDSARARQEMRRADPLIPDKDEARPMADSLVRVLGLR